MNQQSTVFNRTLAQLIPPVILHSTITIYPDDIVIQTTTSIVHLPIEQEIVHIINITTLLSVLSLPNQVSIGSFNSDPQNVSTTASFELPDYSPD